MNRNNQEDTIVALATAEGKSAIAVIRISGAKAVEIVQKVFTNKKLSQARTHSLLYGTIKENSEVIDEVVISVFKAPNSFTREDVVEISCHGSLYIIKK